MVRIDTSPQSSSAGERSTSTASDTTVVAHKRRRPWITCLVLLVGVMVAVLGWGASVLAQTGLVSVPVFTALMYESPKPFQEVVVGVPVETVLQEVLTSTVTRRLIEGGGVIQDRSITVELKESSLTASVRSLLENDGAYPVEISRTQIAVSPQVGMEVFIPLDASVSDLETALTIHLDVSAQDGGIHLAIRSVSIGQWTVPTFMVATFLKPVLERELAKVNASMVGYARISSVEVLSESLLVKGEILIELQP